MQQEKSYVITQAEAFLKKTDQQYCESIERAGAKVSPQGLFRARLFAIIFGVHAFMIAKGPEENKRCEALYLHLLESACRGLKLSKESIREISKAVLKEQNGALNAELKNDGAGGYALATLYEEALVASLGSVQHLSKLQTPLPELLGRVVSDGLVVWTLIAKALGEKVTHHHEQSDAVVENILKERTG